MPSKLCCLVFSRKVLAGGAPENLHVVFEGGGGLVHAIACQALGLGRSREAFATHGSTGMRWITLPRPSSRQSAFIRIHNTRVLFLSQTRKDTLEFGEGGKREITHIYSDVGSMYVFLTSSAISDVRG